MDDGWLLVVEEGLLVVGELLVRQLASPLWGGGDIVRRFEVGVLLADEADLNGPTDNTVMNTVIASLRAWNKSAIFQPFSGIWPSKSNLLGQIYCRLSMG